MVIVVAMTRWTVLDTARAAQARARLQAVAASTGNVDPAQAALAGLATDAGHHGGHGGAVGGHH